MWVRGSGSYLVLGDHRGSPLRLFDKWNYGRLDVRFLPDICSD
jgi:hypothetical protein